MSLLWKIKFPFGGITFLITLGPICLAMAFFAWTHLSERADAVACAKGAEDMQVVVGVIRQAGTNFFVQSQNWRLIDIACVGKGRGQCLQAHPGIEALEKNLGQGVHAEFCGDHSIAYTVAGRRFVRVGLNEEELRDKP